MTPTWWAGVAVCCAIVAAGSTSHDVQLVALSVGSTLALRFVWESDAAE
jgi:hypothetical protein